MTLQIGFLGAGFISHFHAMWLSGCTVPHRIAFVHDPDPERAAGFAAAYGAEVASEEEVVERSDAVYVTAWTSEHPRLVALAARAGTPVLCEKPLAVDGPTADEMTATVEAAGVINQVGLVLRFLPPQRFVRHLLADERAGRVLSVVFRDDQYIPIQGQYGSTWRIDPERCGRGTIIEHSIHDVDLLRWWLGPVSKVSASTREYHGHDKIEDVAAVRFDFESGATATLVSIWHDIMERPSGRHIELFTERGYITLANELSGPVRWQFTGEPEQSLGGDALIARLAELGDTVHNPAQAFLEAVAEGRPSSLPFSEAVPSHRVVDAIYRSAAADGDVERSPEAAAG